MFIDTHSHLNFPEFKEDLDKVIRRAKTANVGKIIVVGSNLDNSKKAIKLSQDYNNLFASIGLHPTEINLKWQKEVDDLYQIKGDKIVAVGEIGLDYHQRDNNLLKKKVQNEAFDVLLNLAKKKNMPVILHCREAKDDFLASLKKQRISKGVWHCFQGDLMEAKNAFKLGLFISFTGNITFNNDLIAVIKYAPLEVIMIETDCPFLSPEPYRGERNEPAYVVEVGRRIAEIKNIPLYKVAEATTKNAIRLFNLDKF